MTSPRVLILAGHGRYEDPWHDHAATSHELAKLLEAQGLNVEVRGMFNDRLGDLGEFDLLVVNGGVGKPNPEFDGTDADWLPYHEAVREYALAGKPILVYHQGINAFLDSPYWNDIVGGRWVRGTSYHPPLGDAEFDVVPDAHEITTGLTKLRLQDERYTLLELQPQVTVLVTHEEKGETHPCVWVNEKDGVKVVYDALGHNIQTLEFEDRRNLLLREVAWLLGKELPLK